MTRRWKSRPLTQVICQRALWFGGVRAGGPAPFAGAIPGTSSKDTAFGPFVGLRMAVRAHMMALGDLRDIIPGPIGTWESED